MNHVYLRSFDLDKDEHPVKYVVSRMTDSMYTALQDWLERDMGVSFKTRLEDGDSEAWLPITGLVTFAHVSLKFIFVTPPHD